MNQQSCVCDRWTSTRWYSTLRWSNRAERSEAVEGKWTEHGSCGSNSTFSNYTTNKGTNEWARGSKRLITMLGQVRGDTFECMKTTETVGEEGDMKRADWADDSSCHQWCLPPPVRAKALSYLHTHTNKCVSMHACEHAHAQESILGGFKVGKSTLAGRKRVDLVKFLG